MRILLDNCVDVRASRLFVAIPEVEVLHARDMGWSAYANGRLLAAAAAAGFSVFVTTDQNIRYQQNLAKLPLPVIEISTRDATQAGIEPFAACARAHRTVRLRVDRCLGPVRVSGRAGRHPPGLTPHFMFT